jgi:hypothetical protein
MENSKEVAAAILTQVLFDKVPSELSTKERVFDLAQRQTAMMEHIFKVYQSFLEKLRS